MKLNGELSNAPSALSSPPQRGGVAMRKSHECHSEPQAKNLAFTATDEGEILRLLPQDDIATQSLTGEDKGKGEKNSSYPLTLTLSRQGRGKFRRICGNRDLVVRISGALAQPL